MRDLNRAQSKHPALFERDFEPEGFGWLLNEDAQSNVFAFVRWGSSDGVRPVVCVANLSPIVRVDFPLTLPRGGAWTELVNSDAHTYGGSGVGNNGWVDADALGRASITLPPLGVLWLTPA